MNTNSSDMTDVFMSTGALLEGHFRLSSGQHSNRYLQCARLLQYPDIARTIGADLAGLMKNYKATAVIAPAIGGILVAHEVASHLDNRAIFGERKDGKMLLRRGFEIKPREKLIVVEDIVTTGKSTKEVIQLVDDYQGEVVAIGCIADRSEIEPAFSVPFHSLLRIKIKNWDPENCPLCQDKIPLNTPGSRFRK